MHHRLSILSVAVFLSIICTPTFDANSGNHFLEDCVKGHDWGESTSSNSDIKSLTIYPANERANKSCESTCNSLSRKTGVANDGDGGAELNEGPILDCLSNCRKGVTTSYYIKNNFGTEQAPNIKFSKANINDISKIPDGEEFEIVNSGLIVEKGDKISVSLKGDGSEQKIYMCGKKIVTLDPIIDFKTHDEWQNLNRKISEFISQEDNEYLMSLTEAEFKNLTIGQLWNVNQAINKQNKKYWSARNPEYVDTGLYVQDGDEVLISWDDDYASASKDRFRHEVFSRLKSDPKDADIVLFDRTARMHIKPSGSGFKSMDADIIYGERARIGANSDQLDAILKIGKPPPLPSKDGNITPPYSENRPDSSKWHGLQGSVMDLNVKSQAITKGTNCDSEQKRAENRDICTNVTDPGQSNYIFHGILSGFSEAKTKLGIKHHDGNQYNFYDDNLGGNKVTAAVFGCPYERGERLQYAIFDGDSMAQSWAAISQEVLNGSTQIESPASGTVKIRIEPVASPNASDEKITELYKPHNRYGYYSIRISKTNPDAITSRNGFFRNIISKVYSTLYLDVKNINGQTYNGIVGAMYGVLVNNPVLQQSIMALLVLYFAFTGLGFVIGTFEMKQADLIKRMVKIAFVLAVISPQSWEIYYENLLEGLIKGGSELIAMVVIGGLRNTYGLNQEMINEDPTLIFVIFDSIWTVLIDRPIWIKIGTLMITSFTGFFLAIIITFSIILYALAILKSAMAYLMSIVILSVLLFAAPFFIPMMLFQATKHMFDIWWKMIISYLLQPVGLFLGIAIFNILFIATLYASLSFSVCPVCYLGVYIPFADFYLCLINWFRMVPYLFEPDSMETRTFNTDTLRFTSVVMMLIIAHGMNTYSTFVVKIIGNIISAELTSRSLDVSQSADNAAGAAAGIGATTIGAVRKPIQGGFQAARRSYNEQRRE